MLVFMTVGCNNTVKEELPNEEVLIEEEVNVDKLREEYYEMLDIMDYVLGTMDTDNPAPSQMMDVIDILSNRQKPTQQLTIELDELVTQFISVGFDYYTTMNESKKLDLEQELLELFQQIEEKILEIELLINEEEL
jgi:hypothetical protein